MKHRSKVRQLFIEAQGVISFLCIVINLLFWLPFLLVFTLLKFFIPVPVWKRKVTSIMVAIYSWATDLDDMLLWRMLGMRLHVTGLDDVNPKNSYLVLVNHQSWSDIFVLQSILNRKTSLIKFIVKRELIYLPIVGLICWAYDFPFVVRSSANKNQRRDKNLNNLEKSIRFIPHSPATIVNFAEGTRFTKEKHKRKKSPYRYLLPPKSTGTLFILRSMEGYIHKVLDVTIVYDPEPRSFLSFLAGQTRDIVVRVRQIEAREFTGPISRLETSGKEDPGAERMEELWKQKDEFIRSIYKRNSESK